MINDNIFICPVCSNRLENKGVSYKCKNNHSFDISMEGYLHLLPSDRMNSKLPGDNKDMVRARRDFLSLNYYKSLSDKINEILYDFIKDIEKPIILDSGCGEGYYTDRLYRYIEEKKDNFQIVGFDISKSAVRYAAKRNRNIDYIVASVNAIPIKSACVNIILNMFSPVDIAEYNRLLSSDGYLIMVVPGYNHLYGLKEVIYDKPYYNEVTIHEFANLRLIDKINVRSIIELNNNKSINDLFKMTPYYYNTSMANKSRLEGVLSLTTEIEFEILIYIEERNE